jgi:hypothetical protein
MNTTLRNIPDDLWKHFSILCTLEDKSKNQKIIELISSFCDTHMDKMDFLKDRK